MANTWGMDCWLWPLVSKICSKEGTGELSVGNSIKLEKNNNTACKVYRDNPQERNPARDEKEGLSLGVGETTQCEPLSHCQNTSLCPGNATQTPKEDWKATHLFGSLTTLCGHYYYCHYPI